MTSLPSFLKYNDLKPIGLPNEIKNVQWTPQTSFGYISNTDTLRFQINCPGFLDPYSTYVQAEVDLSAMDPNCLWQLESSGQNIINELIIYCRGTEIERIQEYDVVADFLADVSYSKGQRDNRRHEGYGYKDVQSFINTPGGSNLCQSICYNSGDYYTKLSNQTPAITIGGTSLNNIYTEKYFSKGMGYNPFYCPSKITDIPTATTKDFLIKSAYLLNNEPYLSGFNANTMYPYCPAPILPGACSASTKIGKLLAIPLTELKGMHPKHYSECMMDVPTPFTDTGLPPNYGSYIDYFSPGRTERGLLENDCSQAPGEFVQDFEDGYPLINFNCPLIASTQWEPTFSATYNQKCFKAGRPSSHKPTTMFVSFPLLSGILGALMPRESYKYVPMFALPDLTIEIRLNPNAFFSSGYSNDVTNTITPTGLGDLAVGKTLTTIPNRKNWKVLSFEINAKILIFQPDITSTIASQIDSNGLVFNTTSWYLGPQYYIADTLSASGTWHVNLGFESLKSLIFLYELDDYKTYSFCRKHFRVSRNLNWLQLKVGINYFPNMAIEGNAGDTIDYRTNGPNNEFLINTLKAFGKFHDTNGDTTINQSNFAINGRIYDVTRTDALLSTSSGFLQANLESASGGYYSTETKSINCHTACGAPFLWENLYVGKSIYGFDLEGGCNDPTRISGLNTSKNTPFEIQIKTSSEGMDLTKTWQNRPSTMKIFCFYDMLVVIKKDSISTLGRF